MNGIRLLGLNLSFVLLVLFISCGSSGKEDLRPDEQPAKQPEKSSLTLTVDFGQSFPLNKNVYGYNSNTSTRPYYYDNQGLIDACEELGNPCARFPGGTFGNFYDFKTGFAIGYSGITAETLQRRVTNTNDAMNRIQKLEGVSYRRFCNFQRKTGAEFTYVLNITAYTAKENRELFQNFKNEGVEIKNVELGNELYFGEYSIPIPSVNEYIQIAKANADVIKQVFPNAKIGVLVPSHIYTDESFLDRVSSGSDVNRQTGWLEALKKENFYDALIIHMYSAVGMDGKTAAADFLTFDKAYLYAISHADGKYDDAISAMRTGYPGKEIWVTEYHVGGFSGDLRQYRLRYSYLGGLFAADLMLKLFNTPEVTLSSWHNLVQMLSYEGGANSLLSDPYSFDKKVNYYFFKQFRDPVHNSSDVVPVNIEGLRKYHGVGQYTGDYNDVEGILFYSENAAYLMLINKYDNGYQLSKNGIVTALEDAGNLQLDTILEFSPANTTKSSLFSETDYSSKALASTTDTCNIKPFSIYTFKYLITH